MLANSTICRTTRKGLVDKRANGITSLRGAPAALATPDFLAFLSDILSISLEYCKHAEWLETYIKSYKDSRASAQKQAGRKLPIKHLIDQYIQLTPHILRALLETRKRHLEIASIPDDFVGTCRSFRDEFASAECKIGTACSRISEALAENFGVDRGAEDECINRINSAVGIISQQSANILMTVHNIIQEGGKRR